MTSTFVYVTTGDKDEAIAIGRAVVEERLAACANVLDGMTSIYRWQNAMKTAAETVLLLKTRAELFDRLAARVKALHSYETPCIVALPIAAADPAFEAWIMEQTEPNKPEVRPA